MFIPIFIVYRKKATPYLIALTSHSLIGDTLTGQTQLLWPITLQSYGTGIDIISPTNVTIESTLFFTALIIMLKTRDLQEILKALRVRLP